MRASSIRWRPWAHLQATGGDLRARGCDLGFAVRYLDLRGFQLAAGVGQGLAVLVQGGALVVDLSLAVVLFMTVASSILDAVVEKELIAVII